MKDYKTQENQDPKKEEPESQKSHTSATKSVCQQVQRNFDLTPEDRVNHPREEIKTWMEQL